MIKYAFLFALLLSSPAYAGAADISIKVNGLVCDFCAQSLTKLFQKESAVNDVKVDLNGGLITLDLKDGQTLDDGHIKKVVTDSGYTVTGIERAEK